MSEAHIKDFWSSLRLLLVNTLLVTSKVVDGTEPLFAGAVRLVAFEELLVPSFVFPVTVSFVALFFYRPKHPRGRTSCQKDTCQSIGNRDSRT